MSYKRVLVCDICGKEIGAYDGHYKAYLSSVCEDETIDICRSCFEAVKAFVRGKGETDED